MFHIISSFWHNLQTYYICSYIIPLNFYVYEFLHNSQSLKWCHTEIYLWSDIFPTVSKSRGLMWASLNKRQITSRPGAIFVLFQLGCMSYIKKIFVFLSFSTSWKTKTLSQVLGSYWTCSYKCTEKRLYFHHSTYLMSTAWKHKNKILNIALIDVFFK